jgi:integrase
MGLAVDRMAVDDAKHLLGAQGHNPQKHPTLPATHAPALHQALDVSNVTQRALAFYMLIGGGTRIRPVLNMQFEQIIDDVWIVPGDLMKGRRNKVEDFHVPITQKMRALIDVSREQNQLGSLVFRTPNRSKTSEASITDQSVENVMRKFEKNWNWVEPYSAHGLRATFRTWASKENPAIYAVAETALAHSVCKVVERSYERNEFF